MMVRAVRLLSSHSFGWNTPSSVLLSFSLYINGLQQCLLRFILI
jgi:hypothetical protein